MLLWLLRLLFIALMLCVAVFAFTLFSFEFDNQTHWLAGLAAGALIVIMGFGVVYTDIRESNKEIATIASIYIGLLFGILIGWLFTIGINEVIATFNVEADLLRRIMILIRVTITLVACYISISFLIQTRNDFRFIIPYVEFSKQVKGGRPLVLDASVIIDGRIADLCETRIIDTKLIVTKFILNELHAVADSTDKLKRNRGRRGLDILKKLQGNPRIDVMMHDGVITDGPPNIEKAKIDERLVFFTRSVGGRIVTNDFNLGKMAQLHGVEVVNLNDVANSLKMIAIPGEYLAIRINKQGDQYGQGVGYLEDGTMVVVDQGRNHIGQDVTIVVTSVLQTPAGRMIFGKIEQRQSGTFAPVSGGPAQSGSGKPPDIQDAKENKDSQS